MTDRPTYDVVPGRNDPIRIVPLFLPDEIVQPTIDVLFFATVFVPDTGPCYRCMIPEPPPAELAPSWIRPPISFLIEMLAAVPSVVYGLWGIFVLAPLLRTWVQPALGTTLGFLPLFQGPPYGVGMLAAGIILAIMIVPYITAVSREVLLAVPNTQREAALALGATRWETTRMAVLRYGRSGLIGAILLGLGRALGETMAVTMVIGNRPQVAVSLFAPGYTMASVLANEFTEATSDLYVSALVEIALLLLAVTIVVNAIARLLVWSVGGPAKGSRE